MCMYQTVQLLINKICYNVTFLFKVFDNYAVTVMIGGEPYTLGLFDTAGKKCLNIKIVIFSFIYSNLLCLFNKYQVRKIMIASDL